MSDVWDSANSAQVAPKTYFGQIFTDGFYCVLQKGVGKVVFDPQQHSEDRKLSCIKIDGNCSRADGSTYTINRELIAEFRDWAGIVLPSLKVCGVHPRDLNGKWANWEMAETGRTWIDRTSGETKKASTFKFLEIYPDEAACREAEKAHYSRPTPEVEEESVSETHPMPDDTQASNDAQRGVAEKFLPALWKSAAGDVTRFGDLIAGNPLTSKFFDLTSPEVAEIVAGETA